MKNLTVSELIDVLAKMPADAEVIISNLCVGRITALQITYDDELEQVWFKQRKRSLEVDYKFNKVNHDN